MNKRFAFMAKCLLAGMFGIFVGCSTHHPATVGPEAEDHGISPKTADAEALFEKGDVSGAMIACVDLARENPQLPGLQDLQRHIMAAIEAQRAAGPQALPTGATDVPVK